jgi:hypothetical protein
MQKPSAAARSLIAIFSFTLAGTAQQATPPAYYRIELIKAKPGKLSEYETFLKKNIPAITQAQLKAGKLTAWGLTRVVTPTGLAQEHDLIGFYGYSKWDQMEPSDEAPDYIRAAMKELGFESPQDYAAKRDPLRDIVRSEIWKRQAGTTATADNMPKAGEYVIVSYLKTLPGKGEEYDEIWKKFSLPIQEDRVNAGKLRSYSMFSVMGASGSGSHYDRVSLARYASFADLSPEDSMAPAEAAAERIHAGKDWRQMRRDMVSLRTVYRSEIVKIEESIH